MCIRDRVSTQSTWVKSVSLVLRILQIYKITNVLKQLSILRNLQTLITIAQISMSPILGLFTLTGFIFFIYAILGCYLFYDLPHGLAINKVYNFENFGKAMVLILKLASGEDSNTVMFECARVSDSCVAGIGCGRWYAYVYFLSFRVVFNLVILNLFILIVLHFFDQHFVPESHNVNAFKADYDTFSERWASAKPKYWGNFIHSSKLLSFFRSFPPTFDFEKDDPNVLSKQITSLKIMQ
eukprot:TRINITY_DN1749_c0_g3_i2.p1 TRINITY_DN1749_c0_g3~~TRINITY_DN1749_c0_g3_i2.p1  ORF type:complete len:254 (-),score=79.57 TRINITY_DN1749_c0_g3_i2:559-1275(-)